MNQPTITFEGEEYLIESIHWYQAGTIAFVGFYKDEKHMTAFRKESYHKDGYDEHGTLHLDLDKCVKWGAAELEAVE